MVFEIPANVMGVSTFPLLQKGVSQIFSEIADAPSVPRLAQIRARLNFATIPSPTFGFHLKSWKSETKCGSESNPMWKDAPLKGNDK